MINYQILHPTKWRIRRALWRTRSKEILIHKLPIFEICDLKIPWSLSATKALADPTTFFGGGFGHWDLYS
ncbi:MAG: hypothetical protein A3G33_01965 [Omnitrophica bacterium RIFCSPLOWO2_12_FULL_44_17]|uniref:Uncharacterized protein n=1 Tax=Candidatus Danuiimicrobium aquiferis TaxID=1801832 RepID=A0A1G1KT18_9BACT|nr:MAG: hypothetical protein A3B72_04075 [Omnitrophica bacterium RIFCSPHIGHO2_02_FULL_45_28]OGW91513.1 MAG: hypothetical protein A3E74_05360 [Omnitrophica bacterium RIFCSPHIGHO2_12_FULL_44_12]OGW96103.1 MAG: hypothetical protein A3G33_01965 [Omnitrophica bacterium RIFCSPLOWO2_12_FULL_44_17]OGX04652.1 MAG: hypothetical protein A3J12_11435 [Omnitrophica bacterium RIFCSPLOWO2_02_FULL_44_11]